jgi:hypothetical protein
LCKDGGYSPLNIANAVHRHLLFFSIFGGLIRLARGAVAQKIFS